MDKYREQIKKSVLKSYKDNFNIDLDDARLEEVLTNLMPFTDDELRKTEDFSDGAFEMYMRNANGPTFSPACVYHEIEGIIKEKGVTTLMTSQDYKRAREMEIAARFCIANFKKRGDKLMIYSQDNPDIVLALPGVGSLKKRTLVGFQLEVMEIPQIEKDKWQGGTESSLVEFVRQQKFKKRYGGQCDLIVALNFDFEKMDFPEITKKFNLLKDEIPYEHIWITTGISEEGNVAVIQVYPKFLGQEFNFKNERKLY